jgi:hypothetical protein
VEAHHGVVETHSEAEKAHNGVKKEEVVKEEAEAHLRAAETHPGAVLMPRTEGVTTDIGAKNDQPGAVELSLRCQ